MTMRRKHSNRIVTVVPVTGTYPYDTFKATVGHVRAVKGAMAAIAAPFVPRAPFVTCIDCGMDMFLGQVPQDCPDKLCADCWCIRQTGEQCIYPEFERTP